MKVVPFITLARTVKEKAYKAIAHSKIRSGLTIIEALGSFGYGSVSKTRYNSL